LTYCCFTPPVLPTQHPCHRMIYCCFTLYPATSITYWCMPHHCNIVTYCCFTPPVLPTGGHTTSLHSMTYCCFTPPVLPTGGHNIFAQYDLLLLHLLPSHRYHLLVDTQHHCYSCSALPHPYHLLVDIPPSLHSTTYHCFLPLVLPTGVNAIPLLLVDMQHPYRYITYWWTHNTLVQSDLLLLHLLPTTSITYWWTHNTSTIV